MRLPRLSVCVFIVICAFTAKAIAGDDVPLTKLGAQTGPTLKFFYCYSCGYRKAFEDYVNILRQKYPELKIDGENFNPPEHIMLIAKILGASKILLMCIILCGFNVFQWLGQPQSYIWQWCLENRLYACVIIFFICNAIEGHLISSGAFEIHFNDVPVWSKLETGRIPQPPELFQIIDAHLQMQFPNLDPRETGFSN